MKSRVGRVVDGVCVADKHGTRQAYGYWGCRCPEARQAHRAYNRKYDKPTKPRYVDSTIVIRKMQALYALGHTSWDIAAVSRTIQPSSIRRAIRREQMSPKMARCIDLAYRQLAHKKGYSASTRNDALRKGFAPPIAWDNIEDPKCKPHKTPGIEALAAKARELRAAGRPLDFISKSLRIGVPALNGYLKEERDR